MRCYEYRYGQDPESERPSPWADYSKALTGINGIVDPVFGK